MTSVQRSLHHDWHRVRIASGADVTHVKAALAYAPGVQVSYNTLARGAQVSAPERHEGGCHEGPRGDGARRFPGHHDRDHERDRARALPAASPRWAEVYEQHVQDYGLPPTIEELRGASWHHGEGVWGGLRRPLSWLKRAETEPAVVAVLDSGVAYRDFSIFKEIREGAEASPVGRSSELSCTEFMGAYDFVHDDPWPDDAHGHGTHIASLLGASRRCDKLKGYYDGVILMPVQVLDRRLKGTEMALVEGIHHAVDAGADVINMSLALSPGYQPSEIFAEALARAAEAGVVLVGAAGNLGLDLVQYPAASPHVIAVGASCLTANGGRCVTTATTASGWRWSPPAGTCRPIMTVTVCRTASSGRGSATTTMTTSTRASTGTGWAPGPLKLRRGPAPSRRRW